MDAPERKTYHEICREEIIFSIGIHYLCSCTNLSFDIIDASLFEKARFHMYLYH